MSVNEPDWARLSQTDPDWTWLSPIDPDWAWLNLIEPDWAWGYVEISGQMSGVFSMNAVVVAKLISEDTHV